jgi:hypothetical protein
MHASNTFLTFVSRVMFAAVFALVMVSILAGQAPAPKPSVATKQIHWHKYVNRTYVFSSASD